MNQNELTHLRDGRRPWDPVARTPTANSYECWCEVPPGGSDWPRARRMTTAMLNTMNAVKSPSTASPPKPDCVPPGELESKSDSTCSAMASVVLLGSVVRLVTGSVCPESSLASAEVSADRGTEPASGTPLTQSGNPTGAEPPRKAAITPSSCTP